MPRTDGEGVRGPCLPCAGDAVYAGGLAALVANLVLAGYIVAACLEDDGTQSQRRAKKTQ